MKGFVYAFSNRSMAGLIKVGYTTRSIQERLIELNSTGVPTLFEVEFYFEVSDAVYGERLLHGALRNFHFSKEFYRISVLEALKISKTVLYDSGGLVSGAHGRAKDIFLTKWEVAELDRVSSENRKIKEVAAEATRIRERRASELGREFLQLCPNVNEILKEKSILGGGGVVRSAVSLALVFSVVGAFVADKISPPLLEDGRKTAEKLSEPEKVVFRRFHNLTVELVKLDCFSRHAQSWRAKNIKNDFISSRVDPYNNHPSAKLVPSDLLRGVFQGLGLGAC